MFVCFFPTFEKLCLCLLTKIGCNLKMKGNCRSETKKYLILKISKLLFLYIFNTDVSGDKPKPAKIKGLFKKYKFKKSTPNPAISHLMEKG